MGYTSRARLNEPPPALQEKRQRMGFAASGFIASQHRQAIERPCATGAGPFLRACTNKA